MVPSLRQGTACTVAADEVDARGSSLPIVAVHWTAAQCTNFYDLFLHHDDEWCIADFTGTRVNTLNGVGYPHGGLAMRNRIRSNAYRFRGNFSAAVLVCGVFFSGSALYAQSSATVQSAPPGTQNRNGVNTPCTESSTTPNPVDSNCTELGPNFAVPSAGIPVKTHSLPIVSIVLVDAAIPKPPVALPPGVTFNQAGSVTMIKTRRETADACLAGGKRWSARSGAASSTTCLDHKGNVVAFQECKPSSNSPDCSVVMAQDTGK